MSIISHKLIVPEKGIGLHLSQFLDVDPCLSLDSPFLDSSALEDLYQFCAI